MKKDFKAKKLLRRAWLLAPLLIAALLAVMPRNREMPGLDITDLKLPDLPEAVHDQFLESVFALFLAALAFMLMLVFRRILGGLSVGKKIVLAGAVGVVTAHLAMIPPPEPEMVLLPQDSMFLMGGPDNFDDAPSVEPPQPAPAGYGV